MKAPVQPVTRQPLAGGCGSETASEPRRLEAVKEFIRAGGTACATKTNPGFSEVGQADPEGTPPASPACGRFSRLLGSGWLRFLRLVLLAASLAPAGYGQFQLFLVSGSAEQPAPAVYNLGAVDPNQAASVHLRLRNISSAPATLTVLAVPGAGFTLNGPALPLALNPQAAVDFTVTFLAPDAGSYSAVLQSQGVSLLLLATVLPGLTYQVDTGAGLQPLGTGPVDFGSVELGSSAVRHFAAVNRMTVALTAPALAVAGGDFALSGASPSGTVLQPGQTAAFDVRFTPTAAGARNGSLVIGGNSYALVGTGAQLTYQVDAGAGLQPLGAGPVDFRSVEVGFTVVRHFAVANQTAVALTVPAIAVSPGDFALSGAAPGGLALRPGQSADFYVQFSPTATGARSGSLVVGGTTYALEGTGVRLTYEVETGAGLQPLGAGPVDFGSVERGSSVVRHFAVVNQTAGVQTAPAIAVPAGDFALSGAAPGGQAIPPGQSADFYVKFTPTATGARAGSLVIGHDTFTLIGTGVEPPLPNPRLSIGLAQALSAQQGTVTVTLDAASRASGSGTLTLDFQPVPGLTADSAIVFVSGGRTATFTVSPGDTQGHFGAQLTALFQTGTTAGALVFTVQLGGVTAQQTIAILPAPVGIVSVQGVRSAAGVEVRVTGFDNARTAGPLTFTFFDAAGNAIAPGAIRADAAANFASYFRNSDMGGVFLLRAVFPVTGDASQVSAVQVQIANSVGTAQTARIAF